MQEKVKIEIGQKFPLTIKRLGINGEGVGFFKRNVVFVKGALPGEIVTAKISKVHENFAEAEIVRIREASKDRIKPPCGIYEQCGGCQLQHLSYEGQLREKRDIVIQALEKFAPQIAGKVEVRPTIGMENPWHYRNKSAFQVRKMGGKVIAGLFAEGTNKLLNVEECLVQHPATTKITLGVRNLLQDLEIPIYDGKSKGIIRTIVVRTGIQTGESQVCLVTTKREIPRKQELIEGIKRIDPGIVSITQNINPARTSLIFGDETIVLDGKETIHETLGELSFDLSSRAFFQLNPKQTVVLYDEVKKAAGLTGHETVVDAYCGVGTIGLWLAKDAREVRGMDVVPESIEDARKNAKKHGFSHAKFYTGTAEQWLGKWAKDGFIPDVVAVDPPRTGLAQSFIKTVLKIRPKRFVYTSCNPSTFARDIKELLRVYKVDYIQPVDMFPQTARVELVAKLTLAK
ncbi:23S rRNA (uracil(1939)-C(5))-methyltransferase RlmD [Ureibacillus sp. FSL K6-8385]|uniref:23S rRNA (uracil(1939)-C(5))-methyltransferase RlmD n=1 Tax=Ureibacillus sp. FSL K6-8385 TaxID=2954684 RepID=UPI003158D20D